MESSEAARALAALRKTREKTCPVCGTVFQAFAKQAYDSRRCSNIASYRRHAEKRRAEKREQRRRDQPGGHAVSTLHDLIAEKLPGQRFGVYVVKL